MPHMTTAGFGVGTQTAAFLLLIHFPQYHSASADRSTPQKDQKKNSGGLCGNRSLTTEDVHLVIHFLDQSHCRGGHDLILVVYRPNFTAIGLEQAIAPDFKFYCYQGRLQHHFGE